jgi:hypothetical protein
MFNARYKKVRNKYSNSGYSNHILNTEHKYDTIASTIGVIGTGKKGRYLNAFERYHIYLSKKNNLHMNETYTDISIQYLRPHINYITGSSTNRLPIVY